MGSALVDRSARSETVASLSRLCPLLGCSPRQFAASVALLEELAPLVQRPDGTAAWLREVEGLLAAHGVDSRPALREARAVARCAGRRSAAGEWAVRDLAHLRCSDVRLLIRVLCESAGCASAGLVLHVLDPLLVLRRIWDDARQHAQGGSERFNLVTEYVRLFGVDRASLQLCLEQNQLVRTLLSRWERLPREKALALWPVVFEGAEPALLGWLPTAALVRHAGRRLTASGFSVARRTESRRPQRAVAPAAAQPAEAQPAEAQPDGPQQDRVERGEAATGVGLGVAGPHHCEAVVALRQRFGEQLGCASDDWQRAGVDTATRIDLAAGQLHVLTDGSDVLGGVVLERRASADLWTVGQRAESAVYVSGLVVDQNRSGPLIGLVVEHLRRWAAARGIRWIRAELPAGRSGLWQYYRRIGFEQIRDVRRGSGRVRLLQIPARVPDHPARPGA